MRMIVSLCVFAAGAFAGFFLTALVRLTPEDWHYWAGARVLWQLGGGLWLGYEVGRMMTGRLFWLGSLAVCGALGALLCLNPLLDLIRGPLVVEGSIVGENYTRNRSRRSIKARVRIQSSDGAVHELSLWGRQANIYEDLMEGCGGPQAATRFVVLRHLDAFLGVGCRGPNATVNPADDPRAAGSNSRRPGFDTAGCLCYVA